MPIRLRPTQEYERMLEELAIDDAEWLQLIDETLQMFVDNPNDTRLKVHELFGELKGKSAMSVTKEVRIVFKWVNNRAVKLIRVGDHEKVYGVKIRKSKQ